VQAAGAFERGTEQHVHPAFGLSFSQAEGWPQLSSRTRVVRSVSSWLLFSLLSFLFVLQLPFSRWGNSKDAMARVSPAGSPGAIALLCAMPIAVTNCL